MLRSSGSKAIADISPSLKSTVRESEGTASGRVSAGHRGIAEIENDRAPTAAVAQTVWSPLLRRRYRPALPACSSWTLGRR